MILDILGYIFVGFMFLSFVVLILTAIFFTLWELFDVLVGISKHLVRIGTGIVKVVRRLFK